MNWEQKLENLYLSQSLIDDEIQFTQKQIYISSSEYVIQSIRENIYRQPDLEEFKYLDPTTNLDVYFYAQSRTLDKKYLETYHYQAVYRDSELIGYEKIRVDQEILSYATEVNLKTIQVN